MTPEGKIKQVVKNLLYQYKDKVYYHMPVTYGYGQAALDFHCGFAVGDQMISFFIETKKPGGVLTDRQHALIDELEKRKAQVFVIDGYGHEYRKLETWLQRMNDFSISISIKPTKEGGSNHLQTISSITSQD